MTRRRDDRGAVLVIVAVFMIVAVVMMAAVVDLGGLRQERREVTLSTDAAALAGVQAASFTGLTQDEPCDEVGTTAEAKLEDLTYLTVEIVVRDYLESNGGSELVDCRVFPDGVGSGYVTVTATDSVDYAFGKAIGQESGSVNGTSAAAYTLDAGGGLRPIGICENVNSLTASDGTNGGGLSTLLGGIGSTPVDSPIRLRLPVGNGTGNPNDDAECADAPGFFGQMDFEDDGDAQGNCALDAQQTTPNSYCDYLFNGWYGDLQDHLAAGDSGSNYGPNVRAVLDYVIQNVGHFYVPVYDGVAECTGNNQPAVCEGVTAPRMFEVSFYAEVELESYCLQVNASPDCRMSEDLDGDGTTEDSEQGLYWMEFLVYRALDAEDVDSLPKTDDAEPVPPRICAVDGDASYCG